MMGLFREGGMHFHSLQIHVTTTLCDLKDSIIPLILNLIDSMTFLLTEPFILSVQMYFSS